MTSPEPTPPTAPLPQPASERDGHPPADVMADTESGSANVSTTGVVASPGAESSVSEPPSPASAETRVIARPASASEQQVLFVPLAVNIGDGFKFGCGFFLAAVVAMLIGFVLFAALFVLGSVFNLNLPIAR